MYGDTVMELQNLYMHRIDVIWMGNIVRPRQSPGRKELAYGNNQIKGSTSSTFASRNHCRRAAVSVEHWLLLDRTSKNAASGEQGWRHRDLQCRCVPFPLRSGRPLHPLLSQIA